METIHLALRIQLPTWESLLRSGKQGMPEAGTAGLAFKYIVLLQIDDLSFMHTRVSQTCMHEYYLTERLLLVVCAEQLGQQCRAGRQAEADAAA